MTTGTTATRMWVFDAPTAIIDKGLIEDGATGDWMTPFPTFLIEHPRGLVLFDTGLSPDAAGDPAAVYGAGTNSRIEYSREQRLDRRLRAVGFEPADIEHVVLSHLHFDHTGGMKLFPDAQFYLGAGELSYALNPAAHLCGLYRRDELEAARNFRLHEISGDHDLFGDAAISLLFLPGHSPGSLAMMVRLPGRTIILSGDIAHTRAALESASPFPLDHDSASAVRSIERLRAVGDRFGADIWVGHDPDDWHRFGPGCYE
ncbi:N-acyl homoserine lactonase family protein [Nocardia carnea]|uniref:N-acyl homoserine lactonase family protein n=1 Tax=Nocardia carnea TaxID=37328 RepID=UPI0024573B29|nr:N-acyl homoserine lactonase family protein [Nocardia carnea]